MKYNKIDMTWFIYCLMLIVLFLIKPILGIAVILIMVFIYPKYRLHRKKSQRKKAQQIGQQPTQVNSKLSLSMLGLYLILALGVPTVVFLLFRSIFIRVGSELSKIKGFGTIPNWVWFVLVVIVLIGILWFFRERILYRGTNAVKQRQIKFNWNWLAIPALIFICAWAVNKWIYKPYKMREFTQQSATVVYTSSQHSGAVPTEKYFDLSGENQMKKGSWYIFRQSSGPMLSFAPEETGEIVYTIRMAEDETREWSVKVIKHPNGTVSQKRLTNIEPYDAAKRGVAYISVDRKAVVVKEK